MFKKIVLGIMFAGFIGLLVWGGINRSIDQTTKTAEAAGNGGSGNDRAFSTNGTGGGRWQDQQDVHIGGADKSAVASTQPGAGQAQVEAWVELSGVATVVDQLALTVTLSDGQVYLIEGRPWRLLAQAGDMLRLTGFYEDTTFEVGRIENLTVGQMTVVRGETGRPLWAGGGNAR
jgi:hypothetical protein